MPSLVLFGQRTLVSGDDLRISSVFAIVLRIIELGLVLPLMIYTLRVNPNAACVRKAAFVDKYGYNMMIAYFVLALALVVASILTEALIYRTSGLGTPVEPEKRSLLKPLCVIKLIPIALIRIAALVFAILTSQTIHDYCHCLDGPNYTLTYEVCPNYSTLFALIRGLLVILLLEVTVATGVAVYIMMRIFRPIYRIRMLIGMSIQRTRLRTNDVTVTRGGGWRFCCRVCCAASSILSCCMLGGYEAVTSDFMDVSLALEDLFDDGGLLDVTLSDIVHGLVLLAQEQREKREARRKELAEATLVLDNRHMPSMTMRRRSRSSSMYFEKTERLLLGRREERDRVILDEAAYLMPLALGIYGYLSYIKDYPVSGPASLTSSTICCRGCVAAVRGDGALKCHTSAFLLYSGINPDNIVYATFECGIVRRPYGIILDHDRHAVVVAVRGTFALEDAVTDLTVKPVALDECGKEFGFDGDGEFVHNGMFQSAMWLYDDLRRHKKLDDLLLGESARFPDYRLYVIGHSLGAGVAAILSLFLHKSYPTMHCFCFEPPGTTISRKAGAQPYITSIVVGSDIVPRLSMHSIENLRNDVLDMIARTRVPKYKVLHRSPTPTGSMRGFLHREHSVPDSSFRNQFKEFLQYQEDLKRENGDFGALLLVPGTIVHLIRTDDSVHAPGSSFKDPKHSGYTAIWAEADDFLEIQLSSSYVSDHDPKTVARVLNLVNKYGLPNGESLEDRGCANQSQADGDPAV